MENVRIYVINLRDAYEKPRLKRTRKAIQLIRDFAKRHAKVKDVKISPVLNSRIWGRSIGKPPRKVKVKIIRREDVAYVYDYNEEVKTQEEKVKEERKEEKKEERKEKVKEKEQPEKKEEQSKEKSEKQEEKQQ